MGSQKSVIRRDAHDAGAVGIDDDTFAGPDGNAGAGSADELQAEAAGRVVEDGPRRGTRGTTTLRWAVRVPVKSRMALQISAKLRVALASLKALASLPTTSGTARR